MTKIDLWTFVTGLILFTCTEILFDYLMKINMGLFRTYAIILPDCWLTREVERVLMRDFSWLIANQLSSIKGCFLDGFHSDLMYETKRLKFRWERKTCSKEDSYRINSSMIITQYNHLVMIIDWSDFNGCEIDFLMQLNNWFHLF